MKMHLKLLVLMLFVSGGVLEAQRAASNNVYDRASTGEAGLSVVIDQPSPVVGCGQAVTLTATITGANGIAWLRDGEYIDGATTGSYVANQSGIYTVIVVSLLCQLESAPVEVIILSPLNALIEAPSGTSACEEQGVLLSASGAGAGSEVIWQWYRNGTIISGAEQQEYQALQSGDYTVVGNEGSICASTSATVSVVIHPLPQVAVAWAGSPAICEGDSLELVASASPNQQLLWYHDEALLPNEAGSSIWVSDAGEYHALVTETITGCEAITSSVFLEYLPQQEVMIVANGPTVFCAGDQLQLSIAAGSGSIEWLNNNAPIVGASEVLWTVFDSGIYSARITDSNGCRALSNSVEVIVELLPDGSLSVENDWPVLCGTDTLTISAAPGYAYIWMLGDSVLVGEESAELLVTVPGSYSVELTNTVGCLALSQAVEVVMFEAPVVLMEPTGSVNICAGQTQLLDVQASAALSYTWLLDGVEFITDFVNALEVSQAGVWTALVVDENGCSALSEALNLGVLDVATPVITAGASTPDGLLLLSDDAAGHQWFLNGETIPDATDAEYLATSDGIYSVISIEDVCESEVSAGFEVVLGVVTLPSSAGIALYPNPSTDQLRLMFSQGQGSTYRIYDASGSVVYSGVITQMQTTVDVQFWSAGIYSVVTEQGVRLSFTVVRGV
jgi:hypothetical protein